MATIKNSIELVDGTSRVLERIAMKGRNAATSFERLGQVATKAGTQAEGAATRFSGMKNIFGGMLMANAAMWAFEKAQQAVAWLLATSEQYAGILARLKLMGGSQENAAYLNEQIYQSAMRARGGYLEMAGAVSTLAMSAKDAFPDPREAVDFMEGIQKLFVIGGTSKQNQQFAMLQLTQGMASGQLQGDEFRSIAENAPIIENMIAKTMGVGRGELKKLASQGLVTADVIKRAILDNMDEINLQFMQMPMTWSDLTTLAANSVIHAFQPVFRKMSELSNSPGVKKFFTMIVEGAQATAPVFYHLVEVVGWAVNTATSVLGGLVDFIRNNMWIVKTAIWGAGVALTFFILKAGVAQYHAAILAVKTGLATAAAWAHTIASGAETAAIILLTWAQDGFNAALAVCPLTWILGLIALLIGVIYLGVEAFNAIAGTSVRATGLIAGAFSWLCALLLNIVISIWNGFVNLCEFLANCFSNPLAAIYNLFAEIWNGIVGLVQEAINGIIDMINAIPGMKKTKIEYVDFKAGMMVPLEFAGKKKSELKMDYVNQGDWARAGYEWGADKENKLRNIFTMPKMEDVPNAYDASKNAESQQKDIADASKETAKNTGKMADAIEMTDEEIKELRDVATQQALMQWQEKNVIINVTNNNEVNSDVDIDGFTSNMVKGLRSAFGESEERGGLEGVMT